MKNQKGFSLIELLIVVVIIGIIAAIAIPNLLAARRAANEGSAVSALRTLHGAEATYQATTGSGNFTDLAGLGTANLIDSVLSGGQKSGYGFTSAKNDFVSGASGYPASFAVVAKPTVSSGISATGTRQFGIATDGVIGYASAATGTMAAAAGTGATAPSSYGTGTTLNQ